MGRSKKALSSYSYKKDMLRYICIAIFILYACLSPIIASAEERVYFYHNDHLGSPVAITDAGGAVVWRADYEPFGKATTPTETVSNTHKFTGKGVDGGTGFYYFGARYYDPSIGRFLSKDPMPRLQASMNPQRINLYAYVVNNPFRYIDPLGLWEIDLKTSEDFMFDVEVGVLIKDWEVYPYVGDYSVNLNDLLLPDLEGAERIGFQVRDETEDKFLQQGFTLHNDIADAWRHARWNERMVNEIGWGTAAIAGYGHELEDLYYQWKIGESFRWDEMWMDLHNNREGRSGKDASYLLDEGYLRTINPPYRGRDWLY